MRDKEDFNSIMFHHFHNQKHPEGPGSLSKVDFRHLLKYLTTNYLVLDAEEWKHKKITNRLASNEICITLDDNLKCQFDIALPILNEFNIKAFWFVYSAPYLGQIERLELYRYFRTKYFNSFDDFFKVFLSLALERFNEQVKVEVQSFKSNNYFIEYSYYSYNDRLFRYLRDVVLKTEQYESLMDHMLILQGVDIDDVVTLLWMTKDNIIELENQGHTIGLHSHSHPYKLAQLPESMQKSEFGLNKSFLESILTKKIDTVSYPCGSYSKITIDILLELGVKLAFKDTNSKKFVTDKEILEQGRLDHTYLKKYAQ